MKQDKWSDPEYCLAAVQEDGYALKFVKEQTPEICLAAVQQDGYALKFVKEQTPEICFAAIKQNARVIEYIKLPTGEKQRSVFLKKLAFLTSAEGLDTGILKILKEQL